jgi:hypothetical protein
MFKIFNDSITKLPNYPIFEGTNIEPSQIE